MILAEKITFLRKQKSWSQEELASRLNVSRQSVSKWELGSSIPDLDKILNISRIFDVSTDYLLKDELEEISLPESDFTPEEEPLRQVSLEEANRYLEQTERSAKLFSIAVPLCVASPAPLLVLGGLSEYGNIRGLTEDFAGGIGISILLFLVAAAVMIFIMYGLPLEKYEYLQKECFCLQYGVEGLVRRSQENYARTFRVSITIGTVLCIVGIIPLFLSIALTHDNDLLLVCCVAVLLGFIAVATHLFVRAGMIHEAQQILLQEGDHTPEKKARRRRTGFVAVAYWCIVTAIYLALLLTETFPATSWVIWPVAGVLFAALMAVLNGREAPRSE